MEAGLQEPYQYKFVALILEMLFNRDLSQFFVNDISINTRLQEPAKLVCVELGSEISENEKIKAKLIKEFKKEVLYFKISNFIKKLKKSCESFLELDKDILKEISQFLDCIKEEASSAKETLPYKKFFFPLLKVLKLTVFITLGTQRIDKLKDTVEKVT